MIGPVLPGQRVASSLDILYPLLRGLSTLFIAVLGMVIFGMIGSLAYPGIGAILGSIVGLVICLSIGCCATGFWRDLAPNDTNTFGVQSLLPHTMAVQIGGHGNFDLIVTVHEAIGVAVQGRLPWARAETYVEVACGTNPIKRTCVKTDGKFNEQFKLQVTHTDEMVLVRIKDQDTFGSKDVGYVCIDIQKDIIEDGFPWRKRFLIETGEHDKLRWSKEKAAVILSFDYTEEYPASLRQDETRNSKTRQDLERQWGSDNYGAVNFLSHLEFNTSKHIAKADNITQPQAV